MPYPSASPVSLGKLPDRPDLDHLKKQAKSLHRAYTSGDAEARQTVRRFFTPARDEPFALSHAQLVLARSYGFDSWPKLKAHVQGVTLSRLRDAVGSGDVATARAMLQRRPELANSAMDAEGERRLLHAAVMQNDPAMVQTLMQAGADARAGIWPHREFTTAHQMATDREQSLIVAEIEGAEAERREALNCPNTTISPTQSHLAKAIIAGHRDEAIALITREANLLRACDRDGASPLHLACDVADVALVRWLCEQRADARKADARGLTPIDRAVRSVTWRHQQRLEPARAIITLLRQRGAALTPLGAAAMGDTERLEQIHQQRPSAFTVSQADWRGGAMTVAVMFGQIEAVRCLLKLGLDPNEPILVGDHDNEAWSWGGPLWHAAAFGHHAIAALLLDHHADPNANVYASGWPLDRAYERGDEQMIALLFARGATPSAYTVGSHGDIERAMAMVASGATAEDVRELVWAGACCGQPRLVEAMLPHLPTTLSEAQTHDMLTQPMRLNTADIEAGERGLTSMRLLLSHGLDARATGRFGLTLLHFVAARHMPDTTRNAFAAMLLDHGADVWGRDQLLCSSALGWACRYGRVELMRFLLDRGTPVDEPDAPAWATPLRWAEKLHHHNIMAMLQNR